MRTEEYLLDRPESARASEGLSWLDLVVPGRLLDMIQNLLLFCLKVCLLQQHVEKQGQATKVWRMMISRTQNISFLECRSPLRPVHVKNVLEDVIWTFPKAM